MCIDVERTADVDDRFSRIGIGIDFHTVAHIEDLVHFVPIGTTLFMNQAEERRDGEKVVLDDMNIVDKMEHLGLGTATTMNHTVDVGTELVEDTADDRCIGTGGREDHFAGIDARHLGRVGEVFGATIDHLVGEVVVERHRELVGIEVREDIVAS